MAHCIGIGHAFVSSVAPTGASSVRRLVAACLACQTVVVEIIAHGLVAGLTPLGQTPGVHDGQVLPVARFIVLAVPVMALCFYFLVVRRHRGQ